MYKIAYSKTALKQLRRLPTNIQKRLRQKIVLYAEDPQSKAHHVTKLQGREGYRLRVGDWRVIFDINGTVLAIFEIGARGTIYKD